MDPGPHRSWPPQQGAVEQGSQQGGPPRPYGPSTPQHPGQQSPPSGQLPPPGASFPPFHQPHSLANLAGLSQSSPRQPPSQSHRPDERAPPGSAFGLPSLSQATGQPPIAAEREREREREREAERIHIKEEEDRRHREIERQRMEQAPQHQAPPGPPVHIHQPVALGPRTVHGPNGLLGNPAISGPGPQPASHMPLGAPSGPPNIFAGGPVQQPAQAPTGQQIQQAGLLAPYGPPSQAQTAQPQQQMGQGQGQGQQPILNDALSYLDQVKVQFADHPDVYNRFLDIMKDFKSGAIDTPGVIGRVSTLFAGNPDLIQGFNTFLPLGYRIECGAEGDPNAIRVTTPMGTTVSSMPHPRPLSRQEGGPETLRPSNGTYTPQPGAQSAQMMYSPSGRPIGPAAPGQQSSQQQQHLSPHEAARQQEQQAMHQQEQRGVSSLQNAVSAAASGASLRAGISPHATPMPGQEMPGAMAVDGMATEKRGPVEFNHAISYVNKIKNRFATQPDIYKQFLEILQTYQRESKPIQDVYSQVTHLFKTAPDLLDDFKQFLPESAAQAKQAALERERLEADGNIKPSNVRSEGGGGNYGSPIMSREGHMGTPGHGRDKMPPIGNFAPTPASKDNKRKRDQRDQRGGTAGVADGIPGPSGPKSQYPSGQPKRQKTAAGTVVKGPSDLPPTSPSLVPALPVPLPPTTTSAATHDELAFFDKAKKVIGNKNIMNEFLKLCNLFSQDMMDRATLVHRTRTFIGNNPDLMKWFEEWVGYGDERDVVYENKPRVPSGRVMLSNCRGLGPSYRLLPKRERTKVCSGRDELCNSVLNDEWASHPTWASEDSGFIAHRKNVHEEGLHRIEEERHDYDYNIEACARTIQLLEPIATALRRLDDNSQRMYRLPPGLGGQSETIYKRIIMKCYGRERGQEVIHSLHERPYQVIPVLLNRLKERLETWKLGQREWEKVWREQTTKMFWKSLDHQAADAKKNDRRQFQSKTLQAEIQVKYEEMKRAGNSNPAVLRQAQLEYFIDDEHVLVDAAHLILAHIDSAYTAGEQPKLGPFIAEVIPLFFGLKPDQFKAELLQRSNTSPSNEQDDDTFSGGEETASLRSRRNGAVKSSLLKSALSQNRQLERKDGSNASGSPVSTPDVASYADEDTAIETVEGAGTKEDVSTGRWLHHPVANNKFGNRDVNPHEPRLRSLYRCWANSTLYCFFRLLIMLYERLCKLKGAEEAVTKTVINAERTKPAIDLGIVDKLPHDFFVDVSDHANYYNQMLEKFESVLRGELEFVEVEDTLRRFYLQTGYALYPFEKIIQTLVRDAVQIVNNDNKEKSADLYALFKRDRVKETSTSQQQHDFRKSAEKIMKDSEIYRVEYDTESKKAKFYITKKDDPTVDDALTELDHESRWSSYIASYTGLDNTDGVDQAKVRYPFLHNNILDFGGDTHDESFPPAGADRARFLEVKNEENLMLRIAVNNYKAHFQKETQESFHTNLPDRQRGDAGIKDSTITREEREDAVKERFLMNNSSMKDLSREDVERKNANFTHTVEEGEAIAADDGAMDVDEE